jgi:acyl-CoA synthetase (AMP-forming)/AMP-acid ligase II
LTYRELDERSNILAFGLRERGVRKGDRVAVSLGNNWEFAALTYGLFKLGAILVSWEPWMIGILEDLGTGVLYLEKGADKRNRYP